ncbi:PTS sugar transporter subunit IIA [Caproiciproducens sp.]|uniref:PTS sugar transporter subunit IIA n=1 Tax=Caproiciproducens sp. TaxID=1954376 RepID=UPI0028A26ADF|nr:PTS sugar transporter subunit IIA [Caproiciproducens sp.]
MLIDKITVNDIQIGIQADNWEDAIKKSSQILLDKGAIEQSYVDAMIKVLYENGPYIVISKHVALAHTRPEFGARKMALSFSTLNPPVNFGSEMFDPIKLIITLSAVDQDAHIDLMGELTDILLDDEKVKALFNAESGQAFLEILKR